MLCSPVRFQLCLTETLLASFGSAKLAFVSSIAGSSTSTQASEVKKQLSLQQALGLYLDSDLSILKYELLRTVINSVHSDTFPSVYRLNVFKKNLLTYHPLLRQLLK